MRSVLMTIPKKHKIVIIGIGGYTMATKDSTKHFSIKQEKMVAKELGGYQVGMSGAGPANPGDVKTYDWLVECKTHTKPDQSIVFNIDVWHKIKDEAMAMSRKPVLIVDDGSQSASKTWCMCRAANINGGSLVCTDLPVTVRKNVSAKHDKLKAALEDNTKRYLGAFYQSGAYELEFDGDTVLIMPFSTFKELFEK